MTREQQKKIAIAEACGWTGIFFNPVFRGLRGKRPNEDCDSYPVPDYLNDLNAMHEAEKVLFAHNDWRLIRTYFSHLSPNLHEDDAMDGDNWKLCHATAAQRAEAFLRTLNL